MTRSVRVFCIGTFYYVRNFIKDFRRLRYKGQNSSVSFSMIFLLLLLLSLLLFFFFFSIPGYRSGKSNLCAAVRVYKKKKKVKTRDAYYKYSSHC